MHKTLSTRGGVAGGLGEGGRAPHLGGNLLNIVVVLVRILPYNCSETD